MPGVGGTAHKMQAQFGFLMFIFERRARLIGALFSKCDYAPNE